MTHKLGEMLLGDLTNEMFISQGGVPFYKNTLLSVSEFDLKPYSGSEKIELADEEFNRMTADYFAVLPKFKEFSG